MSKPIEHDVLQSTRIMASDRRKLVRLAQLDKRTPVLELAHLIDSALRELGIDPDAPDPNPQHGSGNGKNT